MTAGSWAAHGLVALGVASLGVAVALGVVEVPGCPFATFLRVLCPMCGTTRAFLALAAGEPVAALRWNPLFAAWGALSALAYLDLLQRVAGRGGPGPCERALRTVAARPGLLWSVRVLLASQLLYANTLMRHALLGGDAG